MRSIGPDPSKEHTEEELKSYRRWQLLHLIHAWGGGDVAVLNQTGLLETDELADRALTLQREARQKATPRWKMLEYLNQFPDYREDPQFWALRSASTKDLIQFVEEVKGLNPAPDPVKISLDGYLKYIGPQSSVHTPNTLRSQVNDEPGSTLLRFCIALAQLKGLEGEVPHLWCIGKRADLHAMLQRLHEAEDYTRRSDLYLAAKQASYEVDDVPPLRRTGTMYLRHLTVMSMGRQCLYEQLQARWPSSQACGVTIVWKGLPLLFLRSLVHASMFHGGMDAWYRKHHFAYEQARSRMLYPYFPQHYEPLNEDMDRIERELLDSPVLAARMKDSNLNAQDWTIRQMGRMGAPRIIRFLDKKEKHVPTSPQETPGAHRRSDREQP